MEEALRIDLTYITERIITIVCPRECTEDTYLHNLSQITLMLQSKHGHNYMLINLSKKNEVLCRMTQKVVDTGWTDHLAPNLDQIINVCTAMENWLQKHQKHVLVLHCRGSKGQIGVLLASYIHFSNLSASADLSLDHFAMRRFFHDKLASLMTPSKKRYVWMLGSMLKGGLRMCPNPSFLLCVVLHSLPKIRKDGECCLFLRVYQSLQAVCTSAVYHVNSAQTDRLYFVLQPAQLLKGDIMVVCYDKNNSSYSRQVVFRLQFHTGLVHGHSLTFFKADLDCASEDPCFPENGKVELLFSDSPEKIAGRELWHNSSTVTVDYDTLHPVVRHDSFQDESFLGTDSQLNGGLYAKVRKTRREEAASPNPVCSERIPSGSSDSGLSVASQVQTKTTPWRRTTQDLHPRKLVSPFPDLELAQSPLGVMTELTLSSGGEGEIAGDESGLGQTVNGDTSSTERETDILDDYDEGAGSALERPSSSCICSLSSEERPTQSNDATQSWVQQQQMVNTVDSDFDGEEKDDIPPLLAAPDAPLRGSSSREAVQRGLQEDMTDNTKLDSNPCQEDDLASLTTDIDESIEQLNQLILDLDPTFVPVPTRCAPLSRSASLHTNGFSHKGLTHLSGWKQQKQVSDVTDYCGAYSPGWRAQSLRSSPSPLYSPSLNSQYGNLYKTNSVDYAGQSHNADLVPPTPSFPVSPTTPYVKHFSEFSQLRSGGQQWEQHSWTQGRLSQELVFD